MTHLVELVAQTVGSEIVSLQDAYRIADACRSRRLRKADVNVFAAPSFLMVMVTTERPAAQGDSMPCMTASGFSPMLAIKPAFSWALG